MCKKGEGEVFESKEGSELVIWKRLDEEKTIATSDEKSMAQI